MSDPQGHPSREVPDGHVVASEHRVGRVLRGKKLHLLGAALVVVVGLGVAAVLHRAHRGSDEGSARSQRSPTADDDETRRPASVQETIQTQERRRLATDEACASFLRARGIARTTRSPGSANLGGADADSWKRPSTVRCEMCGRPFRDGDAIVGRIAIVNQGTSPVDVYLLSTNHSPLWFETIPRAPPPAPPMPLPEVYPSPSRLTLAAESAFDEWVQADVSAEALRRKGTIVVHASVAFWNEGLVPCGDAIVPL